MRKRFLVAIAVATTVLAMLPARADGPTDYIQRYMPAPVGTPQHLTYFFGPYTVSAGQDANRITLDLPVHTGFMTSVAPNLIDAATGVMPSEQVAHIHHAHWFRVTTDANQEYYDAGLSWVFGTGEEKTQGSLAERGALENAAAPSHKWNYGIYVDGTTPQAIIYMLHNKTSQPLTLYVTLTVDFVPGTRDEIKTATGVDYHPLFGTLFGQTRDATNLYPTLKATWTSDEDGMIIASGGHLHPGGIETVLANLGQGGKCTADVDHDGNPGVSILHSRKFDHVDSANVWSEDYQIGASKFGWRAPIHKGDVIAQYGPYDVGTKTNPLATIDGVARASYQAMTFAGLYVDREQAPPAISDDNPCDPAALQAQLLGSDDPDTQALSLDPERYVSGANEGMINHRWHATQPHCGLTFTYPDHPEFSNVCENNGGVRTDRFTMPDGGYVDTIQTSGFYYIPGDQNLSGPAGAPPLVKKGTSLRLVNEDALINARHTFSSCALPCKGTYVANFPNSDGTFDSGKLGNLDPVDGGLNCGTAGCGDTAPVYNLDTSNMAPGVYAFYCRIHPFMRGAFELVA